MSRGTRKALDWGAAEAMAYRLLLSGKRVRTGTSGAIDRFPLDSYWAEPLQNAVVRTLALWRDGQEQLPETTRQLADVLARRARHNDDNRRQGNRRRRDLREAAAPSDDASALEFDPSWTIDVFRSVAERDLFSKLVARLYDEMDEDGRALLDMWLIAGIDLSDTRVLRRALGLKDAQQVHNIKRRLRYRAGVILADLGYDWNAGDHA